MKNDIKEFLESGFHLKTHLANYLEVPLSELETRLPKGAKALADLHPGALNSDEVSNFYEDQVGTAHLIDLASWHLGSSDYIADTLRLQALFARGNVLDFGGGIGTHTIAAASLPHVDHVWFVDLNPHNREFVRRRAESLGLGEKISVFKGLDTTRPVLFDTIVCLDVLEHLVDPSDQLLKFLERMGPQSTALFNWYFFKGHNGEYPFHFDDPKLIDSFFKTLQENFLEVFHPLLITTRAYTPIHC